MAVDQILRISLLSIKIYTRAECKGEAMQNGTRKAYFNFSLAAFDTTTTTSKIWSLYSFEGFLLYIRDIVKITKVTNIN